MSQIVRSVVLVKVGFSITFKVAKESQPVTKLVKVAVWLPAAENVRPFHTKGNSVSQTVVSVLLVSVGFSVTFNVTIESQPVTKLLKVVV